MNIKLNPEQAHKLGEALDGLIRALVPPEKLAEAEAAIKMSKVQMTLAEPAMSFAQDSAAALKEVDQERIGLMAQAVAKSFRESDARNGEILMLLASMLAATVMNLDDPYDRDRAICFVAWMAMNSVMMRNSQDATLD